MMGVSEVERVELLRTLLKVGAVAELDREGDHSVWMLTVLGTDALVPAHKIAWGHSLSSGRSEMEGGHSAKSVLELIRELTSAGWRHEVRSGREKRTALPYVPGTDSPKLWFTSPSDTSISHDYLRCLMTAGQGNLSGIAILHFRRQKFYKRLLLGLPGDDTSGRKSKLAAIEDDLLRPQSPPQRKIRARGGGRGPQTQSCSWRK